MRNLDIQKSSLVLIFLLAACCLGRAYGQVDTPTPTDTQTHTPTPTPTETFTQIPIPTPTGCAKINAGNNALFHNPVSGGSAVDGFSFVISNYYSSCLKNVTSMIFTTNITGNLASEIQQVQLWSYSTLLGTSSYSGSITFTGTPLVSFNYGFDSCKVVYVLSPSASGSIRTILAGIRGYVVDSHVEIFPVNLPVAGEVLTVFASGTLTATPTQTGTLPTQTSTLTDTSTPTGTWMTVTDTPTPTLTPTFTRTFTRTHTSTRTRTATAFPTGCAKVLLNVNNAQNPVSAGTTARVNADLHAADGSLCYYQTYYVTSIKVKIDVTGNLASEIQEVQLWKNTLLATSSYSNVVTFSGSPLFGGVLNNWMSFSIRYVLSPAASGTIDTSVPDAVTGMTGYGSQGFMYLLSGLGTPSHYISGPMTVVISLPVTDTSTPTFTRTPTHTATATWTATGTYTPVQATPCDLVVAAGTAAPGAVTLTTGEYYYCSVHIQEGATLVIGGSVTLNISGDMENNGTIWGEGNGYGSTYVANYDRGPGQGWIGTCYAMSGAGHGGKGGWGEPNCGDHTMNAMEGGSTYDSATYPTQMGSSGTQPQNGGTGGAALLIRAPNGNVLPGYINMNGASVTGGGPNLNYGSGGSGGTISIEALVVDGGLLTAKGGKGGSPAYDSGGGGGGGGRIRVCSSALTNSYNGSYDVSGGEGGIGINYQGAACPGYSGTFYDCHFPTFTPTYSPVVTPNGTGTDTPTKTPSPTITPTRTWTPPTNDSTPPPDSTPVFTPLATLTDTPEITPTSTDSITPTPSTTFTATQTFTDTPTDSMTPTITETQTDTDTPIPTDTPVLTATLTPTPSMTITASATETPFVTNRPVIYPNPVMNSEWIQIHLPESTEPSDVRVKVFTVGARKVIDRHFSNVPGNGEISLQLRDHLNKTLARGLYFVVIETNKGRSIEKLLILR